MNTSGDAAETVFKLLIEGVEVVVKLTGSGAKNLAAILYRYSQGDKKLKGATNLNALLKSGKELTIVRLNESDLRDFKVQAKKYGILYCAVKDTRADDGYCDLFFKKADYSRVNHVLSRLDYNELHHEKEPVFNRDEKEISQNDKGNETPKKEPQQRNDSNMQKSRLTTENGTKVNIEQVVRDIRDGKKEAMTPENWKTYLALNSQMYSYSQGNKDRIFEQNPSASVVLSKTKWREIGRYPQQGAKGLIITMPEYQDGNRTGKFIDAKVYDISETYGRDISHSKYAIKLENGSLEIKSEIKRMKSIALVPVEIKDDIATDSFYSPEDKKIYIRSDITDSEVYTGIARETVYANAHSKQGEGYDRVKNHLMAESVAYSMAVKYGIDTNEFRFDYIPDEVNGLDGKDLSELINPITQSASNEIKKAETNLSKYKPKQKPSIKQELKSHKQAIDSNTYKTRQPTKTKERSR